MGKAVPKNVKSRANILLKERKSLFSSNFEKNKSAVKGLNLPLSKTIRNLIAGFITGEFRKKEDKAKKAEKTLKEKVAAAA